MSIRAELGLYMASKKLDKIYTSYDDEISSLLYLFVRFLGLDSHDCRFDSQPETLKLHLRNLDRLII